MLDLARHFLKKASVIRQLDLMARYKLNHLHLHLADDEAWRIEITDIPEVTEVCIMESMAQLGHVNEYPAMHYFGNPKHTQLMIAYMILTEYFWKFQ